MEAILPHRAKRNSKNQTSFVDPTLSLIESSLARSYDWLKRRQNLDGSWVGEVELNPGPTAQVLMLHAVLRRELDPKLLDKAKSYILNTQNSDGGWSPHAGEASEVSLTCECYVALRLSGESPESLRLKKARVRIEALGGPQNANPWTQLYLAVLGVIPWQSVYKTPIEVLLAPKWLPVEIADLSYWVKAITVPMALLGSLQPPPPIKEAEALRNELIPDLKKAFGSTFGRSVGSSFRKVLPSLHDKAKARAWAAIESFTEENGDFGGNTCTAMNVLMAMYIEGKTDDPKFEAGLSALLRYGIEYDDEWRVQCCQSHIWDTGFALSSFPEAAAEEEIADEIQRATNWLRNRQILDVVGDWKRNVNALPGGWCFGDRHDHFPVTDCTALALLALDRHDPDYSRSESAERGVRWLLGMQHESGGWSAYERFKRGEWLNKVIKFKDIENALVDIPKADVSAKVIEALTHFRHSHAGVEAALRKGREFLLSTRDSRGLWRGNYGINYIYGTAFACKALRALDGEASGDWAKKARRFFLESQNVDGGWGEAEASYRDHGLAGRGDSTIVQTSWALLGLAACDDGSAEVREALVKGAHYLVDEQGADGTWEETQYLGTVFPGMVYFRYQLYSAYFPTMALATVKEILNPF